MLKINNLTVQYGERIIVDSASFSVNESEWTMLIGPNGAGKSTIVSAISQGVPYTGSVVYCGEDVACMKPTEIARRIGVLAQNNHVAYSFSVDEIVRLGRYCYSPGVFGTMNDSDLEQIQTALDMTGMTALRNQSALTLSGGELQRVFLAQIFAQDPCLLILDEPINHLDLAYQKQIFDLIRNWIKKPGRAVLSVVHDLNFARAYGTHAVLLNRGQIVSCGIIDEVITKENLEDVYDVDVYAWMRTMLSQWENRVFDG